MIFCYDCGHDTRCVCAEPNPDHWMMNPCDSGFTEHLTPPGGWVLVCAATEKVCTPRDLHPFTAAWRSGWNVYIPDHPCR